MGKCSIMCEGDHYGKYICCYDCKSIDKCDKSCLTLPVGTPVIDHSKAEECNCYEKEDV